MLTAFLWGIVAASSLLLGAVLGVYRQWDRRLVGLVLGFGAGALIASVSFELVEEGMRVAGALPVALGLATGALTFFAGNRCDADWRSCGRECRRFAAGALLVMLVGSMVPEAKEKAAIGAGLAAVIGYAVAAGLSVIS